MLRDFKSAVERFLSVHGMTPFRFGVDFRDDPNFVFQLRRGREPRVSTMVATQAAMAQYETRAAKVAEAEERAEAARQRRAMAAQPKPKPKPKAKPRAKRASAGR